jgi:hypothetical protein
VPPARPLPRTGSVFIDARGGDRALRVSWHHESGLVVLSLWRDNVCAGSFRLAVDEVPELIAMLRAGLDQTYAAALTEHVQRLSHGA